jgi:hypothetical protein
MLDLAFTKKVRTALGSSDRARPRRVVPATSTNGGARRRSGRNGERFFLADQHYESVSASNGGIARVSLQHRVVLRHNRKHGDVVNKATS